MTPVVVRLLDVGEWNSVMLFEDVRHVLLLHCWGLYSSHARVRLTGYIY
jgi:hypothetical protein